MSNTMEYKGYTGSVEYSAEDNLLFGRLVGIRDRVLFDGADVRTLQANFRGAVDEYLAFCKAEGKTPDKPFKGSLNIRIPADVHRHLSITADLEHKSLNRVIAERLEATMRPEFLRHTAPPHGVSAAAGRYRAAAPAGGYMVMRETAKSSARLFESQHEALEAAKALTPKRGKRTGEFRTAGKAAKATSRRKAS